MLTSVRTSQTKTSKPKIPRPAALNGRAHDRDRTRHHERTRNTLHGAKHDQLNAVSGQSAGEDEHSEEKAADEIHAARSQNVGHCSRKQ